MNKKRIIMLSVITISLMLVVIVGATYAYFTARVESDQEKNKTTISTVTLASAEMKMGDEIVASNALPGYKALRTINVVGSGPEGAIPVKAYITLTPEVTDFGSHIKYYLYEKDNPSGIDASKICEESRKKSDNNQYYDEMECDTSNLGEPILSGTFNGRKMVNKEIEVTREMDKTYYLIVEYENDSNNAQIKNKERHIV